MIKKIIRDNVFVNPVIRNFIRLLRSTFNLPQEIVNRYRIFGVVKIKVNKVNFKVYSEADDFIANDLYYSVDYELGEFRLLKYLLLNSKYFVDVGANTGVFTIYSATSRKDLKVFSFEPHPSNYRRLCKNIAINNLKNVQSFSCAVGATEGIIKFTVPGDFSISATASANEAFTRNFHNIEFKEIAVKQVMLDTVLTELNFTANDLIKIDVEYYELEVLKGAVHILKDKRPMIMLEILNYNNLIKQFPEMEGRIDRNYGDEIFSFLTGLGYYGYAIQDEKLSFVDSPGDLANRNYLFMPNKLIYNELTFDMIFNKV